MTGPAVRRERERGTHAATRPRERPPAGVVAALFIRAYGIGTYRDAHWPTADGVIPYRRFYALLRALEPVHAAEQYRAYFATALAVGNAMAGSDEQKDAANKAVAELKAAAFPTVPVAGA